MRIIAKDVLHNFYLPQFRVKMDAVPGLPTFSFLRLPLPQKNIESDLESTKNIKYPLIH